MAPSVPRFVPHPLQMRSLTTLPSLFALAFLDTEEAELPTFSCPCFDLVETVRFARDVPISGFVSTAPDMNLSIHNANA